MAEQQRQSALVNEVIKNVFWMPGRKDNENSHHEGTSVRTQYNMSSSCTRHLQVTVLGAV